MRVAVDFKVMMTEAALRGMGRFTQQQMFSALQADPQLELFLLVQSKLDPARCVHDWTRMDRVHPVWLEPGRGLHNADVGHVFERMTLYSHQLETKLRDLRVDLFHDATPFTLHTHSALTRMPVVSTCYDLIPLIYPNDYLKLEERPGFFDMLRNVRASARVSAISFSAADDLHLYSGYPRDRIDIAYPCIETVFHLNTPQEDQRQAARASLHEALPQLPDRFILSITGTHRTKNAGFLLRSFARARRKTGWNGLPLVIVLPARWTIDVFRDQFGEPNDVVLLTEVADEVLRDLYVAAEFVFQPSLYEGFGYPVAEAMSCGAAVIATRTASIPEITGEAALLLDPTDDVAGAAAIRLLATDEAARAWLRGAAQSQVAPFRDPARLGAATLACWRAATGATVARPRIALWSAMPPLDCGIADETAELADALAQTHEVDVYTDGSYRPTPRRLPNVHFRHVDSYDPAEPGLLDTIFQVQVREYQAYLFEPILRHGGTVMLHDIALGAGFYILARKLKRYPEFEDRMLAAEGPDAVRDLGGLLARTGGAPDLASLLAYFERHRLLRWAIGPHNRTITHTDSLARDALAHYPDARVRVVRQGYGDRVPLVRHLPFAQWRARAGVGAGGLVVGVFGIVGRNKRVEKAISAFELLHRTHPDSLLLVVGSTYDAAYGAELAAQAAASPAAARIVMLDYAPPDLFHALLALSDVLVTLRWPALGGLSAILLRGLAAGKPVIVSDIADWREAGGGACIPVPTDAREVGAIARELVRLADQPSERARLGRLARGWYHGHATLDAMRRDHLDGGRAPAIVARQAA